MQLAKKSFVKNFFALLGRPPCPRLALHDIELFPLIQITLRPDVAGNQAGQFIRVERRRAGRVMFAVCVFRANLASTKNRAQFLLDLWQGQGRAIARRSEPLMLL